MPQAPNTDGLPPWLQIAVSIIFCIVTLFVAAKGYKRGPEAKSIDASATVAHLADMGAVRALTDACHLLHAEISTLNRLMSDQTHWLRDEIEIDRELCQRLRELREAIDRGPRR